MKKVLVTVLCSFLCLGAMPGAAYALDKETFALKSSKYETLDKELMEILSFSYTENGQKTNNEHSKTYFIITQLDESGEHFNPIVIEGKNGKALFNEALLINFHSAGTYRFEIRQWIDNGSGNPLFPGNINPSENKYVKYDESKFDVRIDIVQDSESPSGLKIKRASITNATTKQEVKEVSFNNKVGKKITISGTIDSGDKILRAGAKNKLKITVKNTGPFVVRNIYIRKYLQKYTNFIKGDKYFDNETRGKYTNITGGYGCIEDREHGTWLIRELQPGESVTLGCTIRVHTCKPDNLKVKHDILYEIMPNIELEKFYINQSRDPGNFG